MDESEGTVLRNTAAVIDAFGGIRPMAHKLDVPVSTVQGWKERDAIPDNRVADILAAAAAHDIDLAGIASAPASPGSGAGEDGRDEAPPAEAGEPPSAAEAGPPSQSAAGRHRDWIALAVAVVALIVAVAAGLWTVLGDLQRGPLSEIDDRLTALEAAPKPADDVVRQQFADDISALRAEIDRIGAAQSAPGPAAEEIDQLTVRLSETEARLAEVEQRAAEQARRAAVTLAGVQADVASVREQLAAVGASGRASDEEFSDAVALALAAGRLQRAMDLGGAYDDVLPTLRVLSGDEPEIAANLDRLAAWADTGVPTRVALALAFPATARDVAAAAEETGESWADRALQRIRSTVSIRRVGTDVPGDSAGARLARAEAKLRGGDLAGAVDDLNGLEGAAAAAAAPWLEDARARLSAEAAVGHLEALAIARLQAGSGGS